MGRHTFPPPPMFDTAAAVAAFFKHFLDPIEIIVLGLNEAGSYKFTLFGVLFYKKGVKNECVVESFKEIGNLVSL